MATVHFPNGMPKANAVNGDDKLMIAKSGSGETQALSFNDAKNYLEITGELIDPIAPGTVQAPAVIPAGPAGQKRKFTPAPGFYVVGGSTREVTSDKRWEMYWSDPSWQLIDLGKLPSTPLGPEGAATYESVAILNEFIGGDLSESIGGVWVDNQYTSNEGNRSPSSTLSYVDFTVDSGSIKFSMPRLVFPDQGTVNVIGQIIGVTKSGGIVTLLPSRVGSSSDETTITHTVDTSNLDRVIINAKTVDKSKVVKLSSLENVINENFETLSESGDVRTREYLKGVTDYYDNFDLPTDWVPNKVLLRQGEIVEANGYSYLKVNVSECQTIVYEARISNIPPSAGVDRLVAIDLTGSAVSLILPSIYDESTPDRVEKVTLDVSQCSVLYINATTNRIATDGYKILKIRDNNIEVALKGRTANRLEFGEVESGFINENGITLKPGDDYEKTGFRKLNGHKELYIKLSDPNVRYAFYGSQKNLLKIDTKQGFVIAPRSARYFSINTKTPTVTLNLSTSRIELLPKRLNGYLKRIALNNENSIIPDGALSWIGRNILDVGRDFIDGSNQGDRIQQALDFAEGKRITVYIGKDYTTDKSIWGIEKSLLLGARTALVLGDGVKLKFTKKNVVDNIIRTKNIKTVAGAALHSPQYMQGLLEADPIEEVALLGFGQDSSVIEGSEEPYYAAPPTGGGGVRPWVGDLFGWRTVSVLFVNVSKLLFGGYSLLKTKGWGNLIEHCENFIASDIDIYSPSVGWGVHLNGDGCNALGGSRHGLIKGIGGLTGDDTVFVGNINRVLGNFGYYSMLSMHNINVNQPTSFQDVEDITVADISSNTWALQVRVMATGGSKVSNIRLNNIHEFKGVHGAGQGTIAIQPDWTGAVGEGFIDDVVINNVLSEFTAQYAVQIGERATNVRVNNVTADGAGKAVNPNHGSAVLTNIF